MEHKWRALNITSRVVVLLFLSDQFSEITLPGTGEEIPSPPLVTRRRLLGIMIPVFNIPLFAWNMYLLIGKVQTGMNPNSVAFLEEILVTFSALFLSLLLPRFFPVYTSKYMLEHEGLTVRRFLKGRKVLPYDKIDRAEVYIRVDEDISSEAKNYTADQSANLRKSGFKFQDYTNDENIIMNLYVGMDIIMISPSKPRSLLKELKRRNRRLTAKIVELTRRGKTIQELGGTHSG
jgi:hypothetical protein